jgi:hypothetical protein
MEQGNGGARIDDDTEQLWRDADGDTWLSYNDPDWLAKRHDLGGEVEAAVGIMTGALAAAAKAATTG